MTYCIRTRYYTWRNIKLNVAIYHTWRLRVGHIPSSRGRTMWVRLGPLWVGMSIAAKVKVEK